MGQARSFDPDWYSNIREYNREKYTHDGRSKKNLISQGNLRNVAKQGGIHRNVTDGLHDFTIILNLGG